ncbi:MAG: hypothetical protein WC748_08065 [Legionellales bacterium]|jgi:hypothetical protein
MRDKALLCGLLLLSVFSPLTLASVDLNKFGVMSSQYAYVTDGSDGRVLKCPIITSGASAGLFDTCLDAGANASATFLSIAFATFNTQNYAYIADHSGQLNLYQCKVGSDGQLSACTNSTPTYNPYGITFYTTDNTYAYISGGGFGGSVEKCEVDATTGLVNNCKDMNITFSRGPTYMAVQEFNGKPYVYIGDGDSAGSSGAIVQCEIQSNGDFVPPCTRFSLPGAIQAAFAVVNGQQYAYVTQWNVVGVTGQVSQCTVNTTSGAFESCKPMTPSFAQPVGMVLNVVGSNLYAYVVDGGGLGNNVVMRCAVDATTGDFINPCVNAANATTFNNPFGITLQ